MNISVLGLGVSGRSVVKWLLKEGHRLIALDQQESFLRKDPEIQGLIQQGMELVSDTVCFDSFKCDQLIISPGIRLTHPIVEQAMAQEVEVIGEAEVAFRNLANRSIRCLGITGSNGKTTTTLLTTHVLNQMGIDAIAVGNVGKSLIDALLSGNRADVWVIELSSFQLETIHTPILDGALILNITPNHLDWHDSMESYIRAKLHMADLLRSNHSSLYISSQVASQSVPSRSFTLIDTPLLQEQTAQGAFALCSLFGISLSDFKRHCKTFQKPMHRLEWVAEINGVTYYNDSKATTVEAVLYAVRQLPGPLILLAGGKDKGLCYRAWVDGFAGKVKAVVLFGQAADKMELELQNALQVEKTKTLDQALSIAQKISEPQDTILLSPGCASYDQFIHYEARGDAFKQMVRGY